MTWNAWSRLALVALTPAMLSLAAGANRPDACAGGRPAARGTEIRSAAARRARDRRPQQDQCGSGCRDRRRQHRRGRGEDRSGGRGEGGGPGGLYVTPGLIDIHAHTYTGTGERRSYAGDNSVYPDGFTFRVGVTTVADAGCAGWRNFEDFKDRIIDRSKTRILAFLNIVGNGMRGGNYEQDLADMEVAPTVEMARKHPGLIVGIKTAHFAGPEWTPVEHAVEAGTLAGLPVMVDFGANRPERPLSELVTKKLRPGDIYTHVYSGLRGEQDPSGHVNPALFEGRKRGVIFDVGHGGGSFLWRIAAPAMKEGFVPDSISTDLHIGSMNSGMKDMLNVMDKFLAMGMTIDDVIARATWNPAREIKQDALGHLSVGAIADVTVLRVERGHFGLTDHNGARMDATAAAGLRADGQGRESRVRPERNLTSGLADAAGRLWTNG